jgi:hypothetical protein
MTRRQTVILANIHASRDKRVAEVRSAAGVPNQAGAALFRAYAWVFEVIADKAATKRRRD